MEMCMIFQLITILLINLINFSLVELIYIYIYIYIYPFKISLDKCSGSSDALFLKICVSKDINVKAFSMITNKN